MPITDTQTLGEPVDQTGEVLRLTPGAGATVTVAVENGKGNFDLVLEARQKGGKWFEVKNYQAQGTTFTDSTTVSAGEVRIRIAETTASEGEVADFYIAAGN